MISIIQKNNHMRKNCIVYDAYKHKSLENENLLKFKSLKPEQNTRDLYDNISSRDDSKTLPLQTEDAVYFQKNNRTKFLFVIVTSQSEVFFE